MLLDELNRPKAHTHYYYVFRLCEMFPNWVKSPEAFSMLDEERQAELLSFAMVREAETIQLHSLSIGGML